MDGWPPMDMDAGMALMKTPTTTFVSSGAAEASDNHDLYFQGGQQSFGNEVLEVIFML